MVDDEAAFMVQVDALTHHRAGDEQIGCEWSVEESDEALTNVAVGLAARAAHGVKAGATSYRSVIVAFSSEECGLDAGELAVAFLVGFD